MLSMKYRVCARRPCWRSKTIKLFSFGKKFNCHAKIILLFTPPTWPPRTDSIGTCTCINIRIRANTSHSVYSQLFTMTFMHICQKKHHKRRIDITLLSFRTSCWSKPESQQRWNVEHDPTWCWCGVCFKRWRNYWWRHRCNLEERREEGTVEVLAY